jgi:hypothetical protein
MGLHCALLHAANTKYMPTKTQAQIAAELTAAQTAQVAAKAAAHNAHKAIRALADANKLVKQLHNELLELAMATKK